MPHVRVGDVELYFELIDCTEPWRPAPPPVVLLQGLGGDSRLWLYQIPALCGRFPVLAVDLRGHGQSSAPAGEWKAEDFARDVVRLMRHLGAEKAHLLGVSFGGMVAQQFALDYPYATASLVLADTMCGVPVGSQDAMRDALAFIEAKPMPEVAAHRIARAFGDTADPVMRDYVIDRIGCNDKDSYVRAARALAGFDLRARLEEIQAPTLVIVGEEDRVTPPPLSEELAAGIPGARLVRIPAAGHISNMEKPEEFNRAVLDFLDAGR